MEEELFTWDGWDELADFCLIFYKPVLKIKIGPFEPGPMGDDYSISVDFTNLRLLQIYKNGEVVYSQKLRLQLVD